MSYPVGSPEWVASQLYAINEVLYPDANNPNINQQTFFNDLTNQKKALNALLAELNTLLSQTTDPAAQQAIKSVMASCTYAQTDVMAAIDDLVTNKDIKGAQALLQQSSQGGGINDVLAAFIQSMQWSAVQINEDRASGNATQLLTDLQSLNTFLTTFASADQWGALGISQAQYTSLTTALGNAIQDIQEDPPNYTQFDVDWGGALPIIQGANLPPVDG